MRNKKGIRYEAMSKVEHQGEENRPEPQRDPQPEPQPVPEPFVTLIAGIRGWSRSITKALSTHKLARFRLLVVATGVLLSLLALYVLVPPDWLEDVRYTRALPIGIAGIYLSLTVVLVCLSSFLGEYTSETSELQEELAPIRQERIAIQARIAQEPRADVLDTIQLSLNQLAEYYTISKGQARGSFLVSVGAMILGFVTLISGIWILFIPSADPASIRTISTVSTIGGVLTQFIGASYFYLYNKTIAQMNYFYDRLVKLQDTMLSIRLCDGIEDKALQYDLREKLVLTILRGSYEDTGARRFPSKPRARTGTKVNTRSAQLTQDKGASGQPIEE